MLNVNKAEYSYRRARSEREKERDEAPSTIAYLEFAVLKNIYSNGSIPFISTGKRERERERERERARGPRSRFCSKILSGDYSGGKGDILGLFGEVGQLL